MLLRNRFDILKNDINPLLLFINEWLYPSTAEAFEVKRKMPNIIIRCMINLILLDFD